MKIVLFLLSLLFISNCAFHEHLKEMGERNRAEAAERDNASCVKKGFTPNTDTFRLCLDNRSVERIARSAKASAAKAKRDAFSAKMKADFDKIWAD